MTMNILNMCKTELPNVGHSPFCSVNKDSKKFTSATTAPFTVDHYPTKLGVHARIRHPTRINHVVHLETLLMGACRNRGSGVGNDFIRAGVLTADPAVATESGGE